MLFVNEQKLLESCARCMANPDDPKAMDELQTGVRSIGRNISRVYKIMPANMERMIYSTYNGTGIISLNGTINEFCRKGKSIDSIRSRHRVRDIKKVYISLFYDDSNSMTAWYRNKKSPAKIPESKAPQNYAKVAYLSLAEGLGKTMDINLWTYSGDVQGPFSVNNSLYRHLITRNGSGGKRLDLAIESLMDYGWDRKAGTKIAIIMTDGVPSFGNDIYAEDVLVNINTLGNIKKLIDRKVKVLYIQLLTDEIKKFKKSGGYTMKEFGDELQKIGCNVVNVDTAANIGDSLFYGLQEIIKKI